MEWHTKPPVKRPGMIEPCIPILYAFDLIELHGEDWRPRPLEERKARLAKLLGRAPEGILNTAHLEGDGAD